MTNPSNYYYRFPDVLEDRIDYVYYHPKFEKIIDLKSKYKYPMHQLSEYFVNTWTGDNLKKRDAKEKKYLYVKVENISENKIILTDNSEYLSESELRLLSRSMPKTKSILVTRVASFGKSAVVADGLTCAISDNILCFELDEQIDPYFASRFINSSLAQIQLQRQAAGMGRGVLTYDRIGGLFIGVPPSKAEQIKIVKETESKESLVAKMEAEVSESLHKMQELFLDTLGISIPSELSDIDYYTDYVDSLNRLDFIYNNPKYDVLDEIILNSNVDFVELEEVVDFIQDSRNPSKQPKTEFLYVDIGNIDTVWGRLNPIPMLGKDAQSSRMRRVMYTDTILVSTTRPTRNAIAIVPKELDGQICSTGFAVLKCKDSMNNRFLFHAMRSSFVNWQLERNCSGSGYPAINQEVDLPKIKVPKPQIDKQLDIVKEVEKLASLAQKKQDEIAQKKTETTSYFEQLLLS